MTFKTVLSASLLCSVFISASAQAQVETVQESKFDCTYQKKMSSVDKLGEGVLKEVTDSRRKKYAIKAAKQALEAGYNYAYMHPLEIADRRYRNTFVNNYGGVRKGWMVHGDKYKVLACTAYDDIAVYNALIKENAPNNDPEGAAMVDLRVLIADFDEGKAYSGARKPQIAAEHLEGVGTREAIAKQYPVMMAALDCSSKLRPRSLRNFTPSTDGQAREAQCLSALRPQAQTVGLDFTSLVRDDAKNLGYQINRPAQPSQSAPSRAARPMANASLWGDNWFDMSSELGGIDGTVLFDEERGMILLASNSLSDTQLLDYAVFIAAKEALSGDLNVATLEDETERFRESFETAKKRHAQSQIDDARKQAEDYDRTVTEYDIERLEEKIQNREERIAELRQPVAEDPNAYAELEAMMKQFPSQDFDIEEMKRNIREAQAMGRASQITRYQQDITKARADLASARATFATETTAQQQQMNSIPSASTLGSTYRPSQDESSSNNIHKAAYRAFETYQTVFVLDPSRSSKCRDDYLVCADKLQAYNTLGARLNVKDFTPFSTPVGYRPYLPK